MYVLLQKTKNGNCQPIGFSPNYGIAIATLNGIVVNLCNAGYRISYEFTSLDNWLPRYRMVLRDEKGEYPVEFVVWEIDLL